MGVLSGRRILVVDDDELVRELIEDILDGAGADVTAVSSGKQALQELKKSEFGVIVSDVRMPGMTGDQLIDEVKRMFAGDREAKRPKVVLVSGFTDMTEEEAKKKGAFALLPKPFTADHIRSVIRDLLQS